MRVCDITREDEVVSAFTIIQHDPSVSIQDVLDGKVEGAEIVGSTVIETGRRATEALASKDWAGLNKLTPYNLRPKDATRAAGAKKAQATRAAKKAAAAGQASLTSNVGSTEATTAPSANGATTAPTATSKTGAGA